MSDLIDRQAAIDALESIGSLDTDADRDYARSIFNAVPSAQPETHEERTETHACDSISRQVAVDMLMKRASNLRGTFGDLGGACSGAAKLIMQMPSAEPKNIHCEDCKHWIPYDWMFSEVWQSKNIADYPEDEIGCELCDMAMKANDFCSRAERRTE